MTSEQPRQNEQLVAYLDGELNDAAAAEVEVHLAGDVELRREVERLSRTWELLDMLPSVRASSEFSSKTLTAIRSIPLPRPDEAEGISADVVAPRLWWGRLKHWSVRMAALSVLLVLAALAFKASARKGTEAVDELLTELPLIERLEQYREVDSVEFLKQLQESELFDGQPRRD